MMTLDFPTILVIATFLTGIIWGGDSLFFAQRRRAAQLGATSDSAKAREAQRTYQEPILVETARSFFPVILVVLLLRSFVVEPFRIPSGSMMPTLLIGDFILVNKFSYGIRLPVLDKKIISIGEPQRGDVVVFRYPEDPSVDYIKRVVGLPGDRVSYHNKKVTVNGKPMESSPIGIYQGEGAGSGMSGNSHFREQLGEVEHDILTAPGRLSIEGDFIVPPDQYFVMGDNRDNSKDSRYWGTLPEQNLVGKAFFIWMNWDWSNGGVGWRRIGTKIR
ncbi:signal peptidase I [Gammaproteobacteria bacterium]